MNETIFKIQNKHSKLFFKYGGELGDSLVNEESASVYKSLHQAKTHIEDLAISKALDRTISYNYLDFEVVEYEIDFIIPSASDKKGIFRLKDEASGQYLAIWAKPGVKYSLQKKGKDWKTKDGCQKALIEFKKLKGVLPFNPDDLAVVTFNTTEIRRHQYDDKNLSPMLKNAITNGESLIKEDDGSLAKILNKI